MTEVTIYVRASQVEIEAVIATLPQEATGGGPIARAMMERIGEAALGQVHSAFLVKMAGATDEAGDRWAPLKPETVAYGRRHRKKTGDPHQSQVFSRAKKLRLIPLPKTRAGYAPSYALTSKQRDRWWDVYRQGLAMHRGNKGAAARRAWAVLKGEGATTLIAQYGGAQADILRNTGLLLNTLTPGAKVSEQVFQTGPGEVKVGTSRKGAAAHHQGVPGRLPRRRLWPEPSRWPSSWWVSMTDQGILGLMELTIHLVRAV